jgi:hypothetical protein
MAIQTSFAKKVTWSQDGNHRFLALLGNDGEFDLALLDVKNRVRDLSLRKNNLIVPIFGYRFSLAYLGENETTTRWNSNHTNPPGGLANYYRNNVIGGPRAFVMVAENFNSFGNVLVKKLFTEIAQAEPQWRAGN